jgi:hypothetical protein
MKTIALLLAISLLFDAAAFADQGTPASGTAPAPSAAQVLKVKEQVQKRGLGEKARVRVTLTNGSEVKGRISQIDPDSFAVTEAKSGQTTTVAYADVQKLQGPGLSKGAKIGITAAVVVGVLVIVVAVIAVKVNHDLNHIAPL